MEASSGRNIITERPAAAALWRQGARRESGRGSGDRRVYCLPSMTNQAIIRSVLELLADVPAEARRVLDVSCKRGELLKALKERGFAVQGTQFAADAPGVDGIPVDRGVNLLTGLPYAAETFDVVLLVEVIEHLENHRAALSELARVLKPGGILILTTPNVMRIKSRLHFFLTGYH